MAEAEKPQRRPAKKARCAIYTRKSSEEGLEQAFNSLDAQREACTAFILSQKHEGWTVLPTLYDDGGYSGGTMERPALKRLVADIEAGQIDVVVVYKVDRLTRALSDFAKLVEVFDRRGVSFVSVTQQFNTTTSMGRLTLNVLLSFAQFEREVIAFGKILGDRQKPYFVFEGSFLVEQGQTVVNWIGSLLHFFAPVDQAKNTRDVVALIDQAIIKGRSRFVPMLSPGVSYAETCNRRWRYK
jgi:predicted site-specific integrase-resolvase